MKVDLTDGLSPDEAAVVAVLVNPTLRAVRNKRAVADAQLLQAGLLPNPQIAWSLDVPVSTLSQGPFIGFAAGPTWDITSLIAHQAKVQVAQASRAAVELDVAWQEWQVAQAAKLAVYRVVSQHEQVALAGDQARRLAENLELVRKAAQQGLVTDLAVAAAEAAGNQAQATLLELRKSEREEELALNKALGLPPGQKVALQKGIALPSRLSAPAEGQILAGLEDRRLDLVALRKGYESQELAVRVAILEQFPKVGIGANWARDTSRNGTIGHSITLDLPVFDRNQGVIAQERASRQGLFDEYVQRIFETRSEIATLLHDAESLGGLIRQAEQAEPGLQRLVDTYRRAMDAGQADVLSYYTAWTDLTTQRLEILTLKQQLAETQVALEIAAGAYRLDSIATQPASTQPATSPAVAPAGATPTTYPAPVPIPKPAAAIRPAGEKGSGAFSGHAGPLTLWFHNVFLPD